MEWGGVGCRAQGAGAQELMHTRFSPKKSSQCLGHQQLPIPLFPLNPTSSTPSCIPGDKNPEPRAGGSIHPH